MLVELNWTTFILEIINFLVLVWILKIFLYRPVLRALRNRQDKIRQTLDEAARLKAESEDLEQRYERRMQDWEREKQQARSAMHQEIQVERATRLARLEQELANARKKMEAIEQQHQAEAQHRRLQKAHRQGAKFAARLLRAIAGPELELRLFELLLTSLDELNQAQLARLRDNCRSAANRVCVISVFPLSDIAKNRLQEKLSSFCEQPIQLECTQDPALVAGIRLILGAWVIQLDIQDELRGFANLSHEQSAG